MPAEIIVNWKDSQPSKEVIESVLVDFFGGAAEVTWNTDRFFAKLPGNNTFPFQCLGHPHTERWKETFAPPFNTRIIEIWPGGMSLFVMTRMADEYTNCMAMGIAQMFARYWRGYIEQ